jgi:hypothetical protein
MIPSAPTWQGHDGAIPTVDPQHLSFVSGISRGEKRATHAVTKWNPPPVDLTTPKAPTSLRKAQDLGDLDVAAAVLVVEEEPDKDRVDGSENGAASVTARQQHVAERCNTALRPSTAC